METAISQISNLPTSKEQVESFTNKLLSEAKTNPETALKLKLLVKTFEAITKKVKEEKEYNNILIDIVKQLITEHGSCELLGFDMKVQKRTTADFDSLDDTKLKALKHAVKEREAELKQGMEVDKETGELIPIVSCDWKESEFLKITEIK